MGGRGSDRANAGLHAPALNVFAHQYERPDSSNYLQHAETRRPASASAWTCTIYLKDARLQPEVVVDFYVKTGNRVVTGLRRKTEIVCIRRNRSIDGCA